MSLQRKNSRRLKLLRRLGMPISGDYCLTEDFGGASAGLYVSPGEQREIILALADPTHPRRRTRLRIA